MVVQCSSKIYNKMENIICNFFGGIGDRDWTIMDLLHAVHGSILVFF